jgi:DNA-binding MltR family transcriptional regulator
LWRSVQHALDYGVAAPGGFLVAVIVVGALAVVARLIAHRERIAWRPLIRLVGHSKPREPRSEELPPACLKHDERYGVLIGLEDETLPSSAIDQRAILAGVSLLEDVLEKAIRLHLRHDLSDTECNKLFLAGDSGAGILSTFSARVEIARALGILTEEAAEDFRTLQIIRNHFAHARLAFSFDSDEVVSLLRLLNKNPENDTGLARIQATLGNRNVLVYVVTNYYFALDIYVPGRPVKHGP